MTEKRGEKKNLYTHCSVFRHKDKRKEGRRYNHLLVDAMHSQTEIKASRGHFAIKGFSDLNVRAYVCWLEDHVFTFFFT